MDIQRGVVRAYDSVNHQADVLVYGSMSRVILGVPVSHSIGAELMAVGADCGVVVFSPGDTGVVVCTFTGAPGPWVTSALIKDGEVAVADLAFDPATQTELDAHIATGHLVLDSWGPTLTLQDLLGGWHDDFYGDGLQLQYWGAASGGNIALQSNTHGGVVRLSVPSVVGAWYTLYLGNPTGTGQNALDADVGWVQLCYMRLVSLVGISNATFGVRDSANNNIIIAGPTEAGSPNWAITTRVGGGGVVYTASSVPIDTP